MLASIGRPGSPAVLREIPSVRQRPDESRRRWFVDERLDLLVWQAPDGRMLAFQLVYGEPAGERALTWRAQTGFRHEVVDDGERVGVRHKRTPLLVADGPVPWRWLHGLLARRARTVEPGLRAALLARIAAAALRA